VSWGPSAGTHGGDHAFDEKRAGNAAVVLGLRPGHKGAPVIGPNAWLASIRRYAVVTTAAHLAWETAHVPLYTIWSEGTGQEIALAVVHCTAGDLAIAACSLFASLILFGNRAWPRRHFTRVAIAALVLGVLHTTYSERANVTRGAWAYADAMPLVPLLGIGLSPLLQWLVVPGIGFEVVRRSVRD